MVAVEEVLWADLLVFDEEDAGSGRGTEQFTCIRLLLCSLISCC